MPRSWQTAAWLASSPLAGQVGAAPVVAVQGHVEDGGVLLEDVLRAIAVVHVPVQDEHAPRARGLQVDRQVGRRGEQAAHGGAGRLLAVTAGPSGASNCSR